MTTKRCEEESRINIKQCVQQHSNDPLILCSCVYIYIAKVADRAVRTKFEIPSIFFFPFFSLFPYFSNVFLSSKVKMLHWVLFLVILFSFYTYILTSPHSLVSNGYSEKLFQIEELICSRGIRVPLS